MAPALPLARIAEVHFDPVPIALERQHGLGRLAFQRIGEQQDHHFMVCGERRPATFVDGGDAGRVGEHDEARTWPQQPAGMFQRSR